VGRAGASVRHAGGGRSRPRAAPPRGEGERAAPLPGSDAGEGGRLDVGGVEARVVQRQPPSRHPEGDVVWARSGARVPDRETDTEGRQFAWRGDPVPPAVLHARVVRVAFAPGTGAELVSPVEGAGACRIAPWAAAVEATTLVRAAVEPVLHCTPTGRHGAPVPVTGRWRRPPRAAQTRRCTGRAARRRGCSARGRDRASARPRPRGHAGPRPSVCTPVAEQESFAPSMVHRSASFQRAIASLLWSRGSGAHSAVKVQRLLRPGASSMAAARSHETKRGA
jgi:hypothetical protein